MLLLRLLMFTVLVLNSVDASVAVTSNKIEQFSKGLAQRHGFDAQVLKNTLLSLEPSSSVIAAISKPAEALPWYRYRKLLLNDKRVKRGVAFWQKHHKALADVEAHYGVPAELIVAILGVETYYGKNQGRHRVLDSLYTLAFHYPSGLKRQRADFFTKELEAFFVLARDEKWATNSILGSYAGAMGMGQFISSSYQRYAQDGDGDGRSDLFTSYPDAFASVANYFKQHGWRKGSPVAVPVKKLGKNQAQSTTQGLRKPQDDLTALRASGLELGAELDNQPGVIYAFDAENKLEYWLTLNNFYVITRYNHSPLYAMAVYLLSQDIKKHYEQ